MNQESLFHENIAYWNQRAASYSEINQDELTTDQRTKWSTAIKERIHHHFPDRKPEDLRILEVGTGPGFFAIILAEAGYHVTAVDLTPNMLLEAQKNAGVLADKICFMEMNAEKLEFKNGTFDVVISRNLTWNLPHPEEAYREWTRVLRTDGLLLNFDANWYGYLFDGRALSAFEEDRKNSAELCAEDQNVGVHFEIMEDIAREIPLSQTSRPEWDLSILENLQMNVSADSDIWKSVWSPVEKINFASTPMFLIEATPA